MFGRWLDQVEELTGLCAIDGYSALEYLVCGDWQCVDKISRPIIESFCMVDQ